MKRMLRWLAGVVSAVFIAETMALSFLPACHVPGSERIGAPAVAAMMHADTAADAAAQHTHEAASSHHRSLAATDGDSSPLLSPAASERDHIGATPVDRFACCHLLALSPEPAACVLPRPEPVTFLPAVPPLPAGLVERIERPPRA